MIPIKIALTNKKKIYKYGFMNDLFLLPVWFSYSECLTGEGLRVESRCAQVCARHGK